MKILFRLIIVFVALHLTGCLKTVEILNNSFNRYQHKLGEAVIIVGAYGDVKVGSVLAKTKQGNVNYFVPTTISRKIDAFAWKIKVGESFKMSSSKLNDGRDLVVRFNKSHTLKIEKQGIYYYGTIISKRKEVNGDVNVKGLVTPKHNKDVIDVAKLKYIEVFKNLKPVNFK